MNIIMLKASSQGAHTTLHDVRCTIIRKLQLFQQELANVSDVAPEALNGYMPRTAQRCQGQIVEPRLVLFLAAVESFQRAPPYRARRIRATEEATAKLSTRMLHLAGRKCQEAREVSHPLSAPSSVCSNPECRIFCPDCETNLFGEDNC
jgi:hypothetical protein